jgi:hypothetical protein
MTDRERLIVATKESIECGEVTDRLRRMVDKSQNRETQDGTVDRNLWVACRNVRDQLRLYSTAVDVFELELGEPWRRR